MRWAGPGHGWTVHCADKTMKEQGNRSQAAKMRQKRQEQITDKWSVKLQGWDGSKFYKHVRLVENVSSRQYKVSSWRRNIPIQRKECFSSEHYCSSRACFWIMPTGATRLKKQNFAQDWLIPGLTQVILPIPDSRMFQALFRVNFASRGSPFVLFIWNPCCHGPASDSCMQNKRGEKLNEERLGTESRCSESLTPCRQLRHTCTVAAVLKHRQWFSKTQRAIILAAATCWCCTWLRNPYSIQLVQKLRVRRLDNAVILVWTMFASEANWIILMDTMFTVSLPPNIFAAKHLAAKAWSL